MTECEITGCDDPHYAKGWCALHYQRWYYYGDPEYVFKIYHDECTISTCRRKHHARGWCDPHYRRWLRTGSVWGYWTEIEIDETKSEASRLVHTLKRSVSNV